MRYHYEGDGDWKGIASGQVYSGNVQFLTLYWPDARISEPSWPGDRGQVADLVEESPHSAEHGAG